jgi:hypothetical protein
LNGKKLEVQHLQAQISPNLTHKKTSARLTDIQELESDEEENGG